jgi:hypothetical protein
VTVERSRLADLVAYDATHCGATHGADSGTAGEY